MKILTAWCDTLAIGDSFERVNIMPALEQLGHDVKIFSLVNNNLEDDRSLRPLDYELLDVIDLLKPDLMIYLLYHGTITPEVIKYITDNTHTTTLLISGDDEKYYDQVKEYAGCSDNVMTTYKPAIEWHKKDSKANVVYAGYSANPNIYIKLNKKKEVNISFYGAINNCRVNRLNNIILNDMQVSVYGNGWAKESIITTAQCVYLINASKVNLNISTDIIGDKEIKQIKARDFEVPMAGGFLLTESNPLLSEFYNVGKEIETYENDAQLVDKLKFYTKNDSKREKIAIAGHKRAKKCHKTVDRWKHILKNVVYKNGNHHG